MSQEAKATNILDLPEADKPFFLALISAGLATLFGLLSVFHPPGVDATIANNAFTFFSGQMALAFGYYFAKKSGNGQSSTSGQ